MKHDKPKSALVTDVEVDPTQAAMREIKNISQYIKPGWARLPNGMCVIGGATLSEATALENALKTLGIAASHTYEGGPATPAPQTDFYRVSFNSKTVGKGVMRDVFGIGKAID